ncbi:MAG: 50S ribosomal protein L23 [Eubacteriaceae bacterium]|nr:50S ribosomal protein L23 [Eubacteriaceae bacterium]
MDPYAVIIKPVVTERSMNAAAMKKYTFQVAKTANKYQIKDAVEKIFNVKVAGVSTMHVQGKVRRQGRYVGKTSSWKKAIVTLTPDSKEIQYFEGM